MDKVMRKVLLVATVEGFFNFELNNIKILQEMGCEVHLAANRDNVQNPIDFDSVYKHHIPFSRSPFGRSNITAYKELVRLVKEEEFDLIHCHTPVGGVMGRLLGHKFDIKTIYTAHGFHFFKGAPLKNRIIFYPIEKFLSKWTDVLVTINSEDYELACNKFRAKKTEYIPGVGIALEKYDNELDVALKRKELGLNEKDFVLLSIGELSDRKNQRVVIETLGYLKNTCIKYLICGEGSACKELENLAVRLGLTDKVSLLGYRRDIAEICKAADVFVFPSKQEGLPVALMEAMASGLPIVCSDIRGNRDLIDEGKGGYLVNVSDVAAYAETIEKLMTDEDIKRFAVYNRHKLQKFSVGEVETIMRQVYKDC